MPSFEQNICRGLRVSVQTIVAVALLVAVGEVRAEEPGMITGVRWCRGAQQGLFRVVTAADPMAPGYQTLAVQILQIDSADQSMRVAEAVPIEETHGQRLRFPELSMRPAENYTCDDALIEARALCDGPPDAPRYELVRIRISSSGHYSFRRIAE